MASITGWGRSPGGGHGNPVQYSCLENPMNRGAWWVTVHRVTKSWTWPKRLNTNTCLTCVFVCMCVKWPQTCVTATPSSTGSSPPRDGACLWFLLHRQPCSLPVLPPCIISCVQHIDLKHFYIVIWLPSQW